MPLVSVIIPTYNRAPFVSQAVHSVLVQSFRDLELIVVNDGSNDGTDSILAAIHDTRLRVINQPNQGTGTARNTGIRASSGDYVSFLDSDDFWLRDKLKNQLKSVLAADHFAWGYSDAFGFDSLSGETLFYFGQRNKQYEGMVGAKLLVRDFIVTSSVIARRSILEEAGLFSNLVKVEDWDLWLRIAAKYPVNRCPDALVAYRVHGAMLTKNMPPEDVHKLNVAVLDRACTFAPDVYRPVRKKAMAAQYRRAGDSLARLGRLKEARQMFLEAIRLSPSTLTSYPRLVVTFAGRKFSSRVINTYRRQLGMIE